jgi:transcriptional regulator with XRE-family HTH domain
MQRLGEKLRTLRERHDVSQRQLAEQLGFNKSFVGAIENSKSTPSAKLIIKIANFFGVSIDVLLRDELELDDG